MLAVSLGDIAIGENAVASSTVTLRTSGTAAVTAAATWAAPGADGRTQRVRLSGARTYTRTLSWSMGERPCGRTVTLTVATSPAASGGARMTSLSVPSCQTKVTGLNVSLNLPPAPGRTATARVGVTASGTGNVPVEARFAVNGDTVGGARTASLSGKTSYNRAFTHSFRARPCGSTLSVQVRAGGRTGTARATVPCPPQVRQVTIGGVSTEGGLSATVRVSTSNTQRVRLTVRFAAGEGGDSQTITLSGDTAYSQTLSYRARLACGTKWSITASTNPAAANGGDSRSGSTPACQEEEPPKDPPKETPRATPKPESPSTIE